jgi:hypothetical protein
VGWLEKEKERKERKRKVEVGQPEIWPKKVFNYFLIPFFFPSLNQI